MARRYLTGDDQIEKAIQYLKDKSADKIAKSVMGAGLTVFAKEMKKEAPKGATRQLEASIGKRLERNKRTGLVTAKVGINVGKTKKGKTRKLAPHSHLVGLGTQTRTRKSIGGRFSGYERVHLDGSSIPGNPQLLTGAMPANPFVKKAYQRARSSATAAMRKRAEKKLITEAAKAKKGS